MLFQPKWFRSILCFYRKNDRPYKWFKKKFLFWTKILTQKSICKRYILLVKWGEAHQVGHNEKVSWQSFSKNKISKSLLISPITTFVKAVWRNIGNFLSLSKNKNLFSENNFFVYVKTHFRKTRYTRFVEFDARSIF